MDAVSNDTNGENLHSAIPVDKDLPAATEVDEAGKTLKILL
jgi:hypothetical protein